MPAGELGWFMAVLMMLFAQFSEAETAVNNGVVPVSVEQEKAKPESEPKRQKVEEEQSNEGSQNMNSQGD